MKDLVIVGAGGFGRELYHLCKECLGYGKEFKVIGYIDDTNDPLKNYIGYPPVLGDIESHKVSANQVFVCSISNVQTRSLVISKMLSKGAEFINLIHHTSRIVSTSSLGNGCIIGPFVSIGADSIIGNFCLLQTGVIVGHDVEIGDNSRVDTYSILVAGVKLSTHTTVHSNSVLNSNVVVEADAVVGACSFVIRKVKSGSTVFGNPAKTLN